MEFNLFVEKYNSIKFNDLKSFFNKYKKVDIVKVNDNSLVVSNKKIDFKLSVRDEKVKGEEFRNVNSSLNKCNYKLDFIINSDEELEIFYIFSIYLANKSNIVLIDNSLQDVIFNDDLKYIDKDSLDKFIKKIKINKKYNNIVLDVKKKQKKPFSFSGLYLISLVISSIVASLIMVWMILVLKVESILLVFLPYLIVLLIHIYIPFFKIYNAKKIGREIYEVEYKRIIELSTLYNKKIPKKPVYDDNNYKQKIIDSIGLTIIPTIIIGPVLMGFGFILIGIIITVIPWILLILIKVLHTDNNEKEIKNIIFDLLDKFVKSDISLKVKNIKIQLIEKEKYNWYIEILGYTKFNLSTVNDLNNKNELIDLGLNTSFKSINNWHKVEYELVNSFIKDYFDKFGIDFLEKRYDSITMGFVDDIEIPIYVKNRDK